MRTLLVVWVTLLVILGAVYAIQFKPATETVLPDIDVYGLFLDKMADGEAPPFSMTTLDGMGVDNDRLKGKPYLLKGFVPSCLPCMEEIKELNILHSEYGDRVTIVSVDLSVYDLPEEVRRFKNVSRGGDWIWAIGNVEMMRDYGMMLAGTTYVVDAEGRISYRDPGHQAPGVTAQEIEKVLGQAEEKTKQSV